MLLWGPTEGGGGIWIPLCNTVLWHDLQKPGRLSCAPPLHLNCMLLVKGVKSRMESSLYSDHTG